MNWRLIDRIQVPAAAGFCVGKEYITWRDDRNHIDIRTPAAVGDDRFVVDGIFSAGGYGLILSARDLAFPSPGRKVLIKTPRYPLSGGDDIFEGASRLGGNGYEKIIEFRNSLEDESVYLVAFDSIPVIPVLRKRIEDWSPQLLGPHLFEEQEYWIENVALPYEGLSLEETVNNEVYLVLQYVPGAPADQISLPAAGSNRRRLVMPYFVTIAGLLSTFHRRQEFRGVFLDDARERDFPDFGYHIFQDLKPANMVVSHGGQVFLIDFGGMETVSVDRATGEAHFLYDKQGISTQGYRAPEKPHEISDLSDIYSFGCMACHLLLDRPHPVRDQSVVPGLVDEIRSLYDGDL